MRLIATDVDQTLLTSDHRVSDRAQEAFAAARRAGVLVVAVSGRQPFSMREVVRGTVLEGPAVGSNGAVGMDLTTEQVYFEDLLSVDAQTDLVLAMRERFPGVRCVSVRDAGRAFFPEHGYVGLMDPGDHGQNGPLREYDLGEVLATPSLKLVMRSDSISEDVLLEAALDLDVRGCHPTTSGAPFLEVSAAGVTKASGLAQFCARFGIQRAEVLALGDNRNDVEMLRWAGRGVAVANAVPEALEAADEVTLSNDDDGVALVVEGVLATLTR